MIYLASASPRRAELLDQMKIPYEVLKVPSSGSEDEPRQRGESPAEYVVRTAQDKMNNALACFSAEERLGVTILTADTTVFQGDVIYDKPKNAEDVFNTLSELSGKSHQVHTAIVLYHAGERYVLVNENTVYMRELSMDDKLLYEASGEPYGKAGAYAIQGLGAAFVSRIEGSYSGIMGLPIFELMQLLKRAKIQVL
ncbi:MAG: Maf family protein [Alcaligenaceae bacterium]|nr:Maf family protein [Alcaligenaceae bacterium]